MAHACLVRNFNLLRLNNQLLLSSNMSSSSFKVFVTRSDYPAKGIELLKSKCQVDVWNTEKDGIISRSDLLKRVKGADGLYISGTIKVDKELLDAAGTNLKVVSTISVGVDHVDLSLLKERGVKLGHTPNILTEATAELTMALLLATSRRLMEANHELMTGGWKEWEPQWMCGQGLEGSTVGIVGLGRIGFSVARKLINFQIAKLLYNSRSEKPQGVAIGAEWLNLEELLSRSDFVIVTTPLTPETKMMFNAKRFALMKPNSIFINVSRGGVVDQDALVEALEKGTIAAAGLDVMTPEPLPVDHKLTKLKNCVLLPHIGSGTIKAREGMSVLTAQNILTALESKPMPAEYPL